MNKKVKKLLEIQDKAAEIGIEKGEKAGLDYFEKEVKKILPELNGRDVGEFLYQFEKSIKELENEVEHFLEHQKQTDKYLKKKGFGKN